DRIAVGGVVHLDVAAVAGRRPGGVARVALRLLEVARVVPRGLAGESGQLGDAVHLARDLADQRHRAGRVGWGGHEHVPEPAALGGAAGGERAWGAVAGLTADLHVIVPLGIDDAVAVELLLGVAVDTGHPSREVDIGRLRGVGVTVQEVLVVSERLPALRRRLHHPAEVHRGARPAVVAGRALGHRDRLRELVTQGAPDLVVGDHGIPRGALAVGAVGHVAGRAPGRPEVAPQ